MNKQIKGFQIPVACFSLSLQVDTDKLISNRSCAFPAVNSFNREYKRVERLRHG